MPTAVPQPIQSYFSPVLEPLERVKESLIRIVPPESQLLAQSIHHSLGSGGKYLRPVVTLLAGVATGETSAGVSDGLIEAAAVTEMIHIATLLHDDVLDEAELRRGKQTVRSLWGNTVSVLSGDYLLAQASLKLANVGNIRLVAIYSHVLSDLCDGEVEQIRSSYSIDTTWDSYYRKTICKTASLFSAGCESAAVLNGLPEERIEALKTYGLNFGIAFQIVDDLLDYTSSEAEMGKPVLGDLRDGLLNAPILLALESDNLSETDKERLKREIQRLFDSKDDATVSEEAVRAVQSILMESGALEETRALADRYVEDAATSLEFLPDSTEKEALLGLVRYITHRRN